MTLTATFLEQDGQRPEEVAALLAEFLAGARAALHLAIYDFRLSEALAQPVVEALRERARAGVEVRIAYDAGKRTVPFHQTGADPAPPGTAEFIAQLGPGIQAKPITGGDPRLPKLMHHKYIIRDGRNAAGAVWTGSTNFTDDSWSLMENNILRVESPALCGYYETDFEELWSRGDIATTGLHDVGTISVAGTKIEVAFAPGEGRTIDHDVARHIGAARRRLKVCSMLITSGAILGALADHLHSGRGPQLDGVYDRTQMKGVFDQWRNTPAEWKIQLFEALAPFLAGKRSTPYTPQGRHDFMHNKVVVADDTVITGSYNLSHSAIDNAENILLIQDHDLAEQYATYIDHLAERYKAP
ncbi:MAG: phosphatidylserine/phosphatidylglycerophosphate/cardiolipin synthase family protein [Planctomycetes bacterium]|nr:phosphatidylserine/phosphatidylglycerophosphate/cardiolipin synthase family protein [Planctomycetota bacterium]